MGEALTPATFLNPLFPIVLGSRAARVVGRSAVDLAKGAVDTTAEGVATATRPMATAATDVASFLSVSVKEIGETVRDTSKKILIGQTVLVGGAVVIAVAAAWYFSRSPETRAATKTAALTGARYLLTKGRS